ncbi:MAG: proteinase inhibitor, partial [Polyangiaceae bacterium]|nr:proteinase inhibitor [Polyangiaceae bacterium]
ISDSGLAMMAGLADSVALGAFLAGENNGFDRTTLGVPTTDIPRMKALLLAEWERRGFAPEDGAKYPAFGGPLVDQLKFKPEPCKEGEGVDGAGKIRWNGGEARYLYVLPEGAASPGVPPNLDEPAGTLWLIDVPTKEAPFASGLTYGAVSGAQRQRLPAAGPAPALVPGARYHLHVLRDIGFPITRCLFTAPG